MYMELVVARTPDSNEARSNFSSRRHTAGHQHRYRGTIFLTQVHFISSIRTPYLQTVLDAQSLVPSASPWRRATSDDASIHQVQRAKCASIRLYDGTRNPYLTAIKRVFLQRTCQLSKNG